MSLFKDCCIYRVKHLMNGQPDSINTFPNVLPFLFFRSFIIYFVSTNFQPIKRKMVLKNDLRYVYFGMCRLT
jgi:hypothetical protein